MKKEYRKLAEFLDTDNDFYCELYFDFEEDGTGMRDGYYASTDWFDKNDQTNWFYKNDQTNEQYLKSIIDWLKKDIAEWLESNVWGYEVKKIISLNIYDEKDNLIYGGPERDLPSPIERGYDF